MSLREAMGVERRPPFDGLGRRGDQDGRSGPLSLDRFFGLNPGIGMTSAIQVYCIMPCARSRSADDCRDVVQELFGLLAGRIAAQHSKLPVDQELGEVPLDRLRAQEAGRVLFERLKQRMGVCAVDFNPREHRERHVILVDAKFADCSLVPWLLMAELVARKSEHGEAALAKAPVQRFEARVLRGEAALARNIDDQQRLTRKVADRVRFAVDRLYRDAWRKGQGKLIGQYGFLKSLSRLRQQAQQNARSQGDCRLRERARNIRGLG
jgi:hypothetical protein